MKTLCLIAVAALLPLQASADEYMRKSLHLPAGVFTANEIAQIYYSEPGYRVQRIATIAANRDRARRQMVQMLRTSCAPGASVAECLAP